MDANQIISALPVPCWERQLTTPAGNPPSERLWVFPALLALLFTTTLLRLGFATHYFGFWTGDDVEILQAGFARAFGYTFQPWQIRHQLLPDLVVAPLLRLTPFAGITSTDSLVLVARLPFVLISSLNVWLVFQLANTWLNDRRQALLAATVYSLHWLPLAFGSTTYPRTVTTACILAAALMISRAECGWRWPAAAGGAIAMAFAFRFSEVVFIIPCWFLILVDRPTVGDRIRQTLALVAGLCLVATVVIGIEDWLTFGSPFSSLIHFAQYTLIEKNASAVEANQPWYFYLWRLPKWLPLTILILIGGTRRLRPLLRPLLFVGAHLVVLSLIHHKELRYLQGVMPFVAIAVAAAAWDWWQRGRRVVTALLLGLSITWGLTGLTFLSKTSMAAVLAARDLGAHPEIQSIALSQPWAYGKRLWLRHHDIRDLPPQPTRSDLRRITDGCQVVSLYQDVVQADPTLTSWLTANGFRATATYHHLRSRAVVVFTRELDLSFRGPMPAAAGESASDVSLNEMSMKPRLSSVTEHSPS